MQFDIKEGIVTFEGTEVDDMGRRSITASQIARVIGEIDQKIERLQLELDELPHAGATSVYFFPEGYRLTTIRIELAAFAMEQIL